MSDSVPVYVNARFLAEPLTGVQRCGREILSALDELLHTREIDRDRYQFILLSPKPPTPATAYRHLEIRVRGPIGSHGWEQILLPFRAKKFLLNLKNTAPVFHPKMAMFIHDLQVFARPETHSKNLVRLYQWVLPRASKRAGCVLVPSESTSKEVQHWLGISPQKIKVIPEGHEHVFREAADGEILSRHNIKSGSYLLAVSSLNPNKNFAAVLRALKLAELENLPFVIAGGTNPKVFEGSSIEQLPTGALHVGRVSDGELRSLYENALGFVYPSFYEGFGLPPLEAMALGCPVISSRTSSLPEVGGDAVLYCDPHDDQDIARQLQRLVNDAPLRSELSAKGRARAQEFTWIKCARELWNAIRPLVDAAAK